MAIDQSAMSQTAIIEEPEVEGKSESEILTVGHSTLPYESFRDILREHAVEAIADVRSVPYSRRFPHFNRPELKERLRKDNISYVFLGTELGGRPDNQSLFSHGVADYEKMALTAPFNRGLERLIEGSSKLRVALMCSEQNPLDCHRCLLVGRALKRKGIKVSHILGTRQKVPHCDIETKLLEMDKSEHDDLFISPSKRLNDAYKARAQKVAYVERSLDEEFTNDLEQ